MIRNLDLGLAIWIGLAGLVLAVAFGYMVGLCLQVIWL
jgi:hypothetical protein